LRVRDVVRSTSALVIAIVAVACSESPGIPVSAASPVSTKPTASGTATSVPGCVDCVTRDDAVLGLSFPAPRAFFYVPAVPAQSTDLVLTDTARLSSYPLGSKPADMNGELLVELFLAPRKAQDLAAIANSLFSGSPANRSEMTIGGRKALRVEGDFQNGPRVYVLVLVDQDRVLVVGEFPRQSRRSADFERLLQYLTFH
jgi:hypothetical protein